MIEVKMSNNVTKSSPERQDSLTCSSILRSDAPSRSAATVARSSSSPSPIPSADDLLSRFSSNANLGSGSEDGNAKVTFEPHYAETTPCSPVWACEWSNDGKILATSHGAPDPCVRLWSSANTRTPGKAKWRLTATLRGGEGDVTKMQRTIRSISFAPTPSNVRYVFASASFDGTISIWEDFSSDSSSWDDSTGTTPTRMSMLDHGDDHQNDYGNFTNGWECTAQLEGHENEVKDVVWNATGTLLASCGRDKSVWIWESFLSGTIGAEGTGSNGGSGSEGDFECLAVLHGHTGDVKSVVFAPSHGQWGDGDDILLSASYDDTIRCWAEDAGDWYCAATLSSVHTSTIWSLAMSPGGVRMISGSADCSLAIWRCYTASEKKNIFPDETNSGGSSNGLWKCVGKLPSAHKLSIYSVHCAPSRVGHGRIASAGADDCINIYREEGGSSDAPLFALDSSTQKAHAGDVNCIRWHPHDGTVLASVGDDGLVKIWKYDINGT